MCEQFNGTVKSSMLLCKVMQALLSFCLRFIMNTLILNTRECDVCISEQAGLNISKWHHVTTQSSESYLLEFPFISPMEEHVNCSKFFLCRYFHEYIGHE